MGVGSSDLGSALWMVGGFLLVVAAVIGVVAWIGHRRGTHGVALRAALALSLAWLVLAVIATPFAITQTVTSASVFVTDLPITTAWPEALPCGESAQAAGTYLECANLSTADAWIVGLSTAPRLLLALGQLLGSILTALPAVVIAVVCRQMLRGTPFAPVVGRTFLIAAAVVLVAGIGVDLAVGIGRGLAASEVLPSPGDGSAVTIGSAYSLTVQLWPFGAAPALLAFAAVYRHGWRLERDTKGLV